MKRSNIGYARTFHLPIITINFITFNLVKFEQWSVFDVEVSILEKINFPEVTQQQFNVTRMLMRAKIN